MERFLIYSMLFVLALTVGGLAGYLVFVSPLWLFGQEPKDMVLWGWVTGLLGIITFVAVSAGTFFGMHALLSD